MIHLRPIDRPSTVQRQIGLLAYRDRGSFDARGTTPNEYAADRWVHVLGLSLGAIGTAVLVARIAAGTQLRDAAPILVYVIGLLSMLSCSAAYNLAPALPMRPLLRRFDKAAIFLMIAGTYTPFTARHLAGEWSVVLTGFIWIAALFGVVAQLVVPRCFEGRSVIAYLLLGWVALVAFGPLTAGLDRLTIDLLVAGGLLYTVGVGFHLWRTLPFQNAIWHGFILAAASCHYAAILRGASA
jgi:hemolysin III